VRRVGLRPRAQLDLEEIAQFTSERWGSAQRRRYLALLGTALKALAANPALGRIRDDLEFDCRSFRKGRHVIFYRVAPEGVDVLRILHDAMDPSLHLFLDEPR